MGAITFSLRWQEGKDFTQPLFSLHKRVLYWKESIEIIRQHPFKGIGIGNLSLKETRFSHNSYLQLWAETGILGLLSWLGIIFIFLTENIKKIKLSSNKKFLAGIISGGVAFLLHNLIDFSFFIPQISFLWWVILGMDE
jgi:O-antigen ligase